MAEFLASVDGPVSFLPRLNQAFSDAEPVLEQPHDVPTADLPFDTSGTSGAGARAGPTGPTAVPTPPWAQPRDLSGERPLSSLHQLSVRPSYAPPRSPSTDDEEDVLYGDVQPPRQEARKATIASASRDHGGGAEGHKYHGVRGRSVRSGLYEVSVNWKSRTYDLGRYATDIDAAKAYDWAARLLGKATLNFGREVDLGEPPRTPAAKRLLNECTKLRTTRRPSYPRTAAPLSRRPAQQPARPSARADAGSGVAAVSGPSRRELLSQLLVALRMRRLRENDLVLDGVADGPLRDVMEDVRGGRQCSDLGGYALADLLARLRISLRVRAISESGIYVDMLNADEARIVLQDVLRLAAHA